MWPDRTHRGKPPPSSQIAGPSASLGCRSELPSPPAATRGREFGEPADLFCEIEAHRVGGGDPLSAARLHGSEPLSGPGRLPYYVV